MGVGDIIIWLQETRNKCGKTTREYPKLETIRVIIEEYERFKYESENRKTKIPLSLSYSEGYTLGVVGRQDLGLENTTESNGVS